MEQAHEAYALADPSFYDAMHSAQTAGASFAVADRELPDGWTLKEQDDWLVIDPHRGRLPTQGWKIHGSATMRNAEGILAAVWDYCVPRGIQFKFLRSEAALK